MPVACSGDAQVSTPGMPSSGDPSSGIVPTTSPGEAGSPAPAGAPVAGSPTLPGAPVTIGSCDATTTSFAGGRRLSPGQYRRTVEDALGINLDAVDLDSVPQDVRVDGFSNSHSSQITSFEHVEAYAQIATQIAAASTGTLLARFGCPSGGAECQASFVSELALSLYRRPPTDRELSSLGGLFAVAQAEGDGPETGAALVLEVMLQSPSFLYQLEATPAAGAELSGYEVASRLSYLASGTAPDEPLMAAAANGELADPAARQLHADRLLSTGSGRAAALDYARDWLDLEGLAGLQRSTERYPDFSSELAEDLAEEPQRLVEAIFFDEPAALTSLVNVPFTFLTPQLAALYGIEPAGPGWQRYELDASTGRRGILTQPGVLAVSGAGDIPSLVRRALYVMENVLCSEVAPPPPDIVQDGDVSQGRSQRDSAEERLANAACGVCHSQFDPLAFAFEPFDAVGAERQVDEAGNPLKSDGFLPADPQQTFAGAVEYVELLASRPEVQRCLEEKVAQYALGRPLNPQDACWLSEVSSAAPSHTYRELIVAIVGSPNFSRIGGEQ